MKPSLTRYKKSRRGYLTVLLITTTMLTFAPLTTHMASITHQRHTQSQLVTAVATRQGLSPKLVASIVQVESSGRPSVVSKKSAVGLMQVHLPTWSHKWSRKQLLDPERNLMAGTTILKQYMRESGSLEEALRKYSGGARDYAKKVRNGMRG
jgi:soluble lytic murein transglycosylase-like protein